ncbi:MAG TPA: phosphoribosyltransferase family protein, partial [Chitinophagaceae bacterium]|nr:phosphoribosyltransferase family protein [Chitinophagaceae bacterium]
MSVIQVHDKKFETFLSEDVIQKRIAELAIEIARDYTDKKPLFIAILNGSFMFAADLFKHLQIEAEICFIKLASYKG